MINIAPWGKRLKKSLKYLLLTVLLLSVIFAVFSRMVLETAKNNPIELRQSLEQRFGINIRYQSANMQTQLNNWTFSFQEFKVTAGNVAFHAEEIHFRVSFFHNFFNSEPSFLNVNNANLALSQGTEERASNAPIPLSTIISTFNLISLWGNIDLNNLILTLSPNQEELRFSYINYQDRPSPRLTAQLAYTEPSTQLSIPNVWFKAQLDQQQWQFRSELPFVITKGEQTAINVDVSGTYNPLAFTINTLFSGKARLKSGTPLQDVSANAFLELAEHDFKAPEKLILSNIKISDLSIDRIKQLTAPSLWQINLSQQPFSILQQLFAQTGELKAVNHSEGTINHLQVTYDTASQSLLNLSLRSSGLLLELDSSYVSTIGPIDLTARYQEGRGTIQANAEFFQLGLPQLYKGIKTAKNLSLSGNFIGAFDPVPNLFIDDIQLQTPHGSNVSMKTQLTNLTSTPSIYYSIHSPSMPAHEVKTWYPNAQPSGVQRWIQDNLKGGSINDFFLEVSGTPESIADSSHIQHHFKMELFAKDLALSPISNWIPITVQDGHLIFFKNNLSINIDKAQSKSIQLSETIVQYLADDPHKLHINGTGLSKSSNIQSYLQDSRLDDLIGINAFLDQTEFISGNIKTDLSMKIDLAPETTQRLSILGKAHFQNASAIFLEETFQNINGVIAFNNNLINSQNLQLNWREQPAKLALFSQPNVPQYPLKFSADFRFKPALFLPLVSGDAPVTLEVLFPAKSTSSTLLISGNSSFEGINSSWPLPFNKQANAKMPLSITGAFSTSNGLTLQGNLNQIAGMDFHHHSREALQHLNLWVGNAPDHMPTTQNTALYIDLPVASYDRWQTVFRTQQSSNASSLRLPPLQHINASIKRFRVKDHALSDLTIQAHRLNSTKSWTANVTSDLLSGQLVLDPLSQSIDASLTELNFHPVKTKSKAALCEPLTPFWSTLTLTVDRFVLAGQPIGTLSLTSHAHQNRISIPSLTITHGDDTIIATHLITSDTAALNQLEVTAQTENLKKILILSGVSTESMSAEAVQLNASLAWPDGINCARKHNVVGQIKMKTGKGILDGVNIGAGKVLGLLNLSSLKRRLTLDVSDITNPGLAFDDASFNFSMDNGNINLDKVLIESTAADMDISGQADTLNETLNLRALVTPKYIGSAISVYALLGISTLNIAAGIGLFLANEAVEQTDGDDILTEVYQINGNWKTPSIRKE